MRVRMQLFKPGAVQPYQTLYMPSGAPPRVKPYILNGSFEKVRGDFSDKATIEVQHPVAFSVLDRVKIWLWDNDTPVPNYVGAIISEPWLSGAGAIECISLLTLVQKSVWRGTAKGTLKPFLEQVFSQASLPAGITVGTLAEMPLTLSADTPFELLGNTFKVLEPAMGQYTLNVNNELKLVVTEANRNVITHRFTSQYADMPQGNAESYANCLLISYEMPSGETGFFEARAEDEVLLRGGEVWDESDATVRELGLPIEPFHNENAEVTQTILIANNPAFRYVHKAAKPIFDQAVLMDSPTITLEPVTGADLSRGYQNEGGYVEPATESNPAANGSTFETVTVRNDPTGARYFQGAPEAVKENARLDISRGLWLKLTFDVKDEADRLYKLYLEEMASLGQQVALTNDYFYKNLKMDIYASLSVLPGWLPVDALMIVKRGSRNRWYFGQFEGGGGYGFVESFLPAEGALTSQSVGVQLGWKKAGGLPIYRLQVAVRPYGTSGNFNGGPAAPGTIFTVEDPDDKVDELIIAYTAKYRRALIANGIDPQPIILYGGGKLGQTTKITSSSLYPTYYPLPAGTDHSQVKNIYTASGIPVDLGVISTWHEFPFLSGTLDYKTSSLKQLDAQTMSLGTVVIDLPQSTTLELGTSVEVDTPPNSGVGGVYVFPEVTAAVKEELEKLAVQRGSSYGDELILWSRTQTPVVGEALPASENQVEGKVRFAVRKAITTPVKTVVLTGARGKLGIFRIREPQLDQLVGYGQELLRYRIYPVRSWKGYIPRLKTVPCNGLAAFSSPSFPEDQMLEVQRVITSFAGQIEVQAGTPLPSSDEDAVVEALQNVRRTQHVQRRAGGQK